MTIATSHPNAWCILRMAGASTLSVADSLSDAGFDVWTPREVNRNRIPSSRTKRKETVPVMPTYCFAKAVHLGEMIELSQASVSEHPSFSVFRYFDRFPLIADRTLDPLRVAERKGQPLEEVVPLIPGDLVRYSEAGFQGLSGVVVQTRLKGKMALVAFGALKIEIASMLLLPEAQAKAA